MKNVKRLAGSLIALSALFIIPSCGKYEEGPGFSLLTKKMRLVGKWDRKEIVYSDGTVEQDTDDEIVDFQKDGVYAEVDGNVSYNGTWEFADDKEDIKIRYTYGSVSYEYSREILRLTNKELWVEIDNDEYWKFEKQ